MGTMNKTISIHKILLIESDEAPANEVRAALAEAGSGSFEVEWVRTLSEALERLNGKRIDAVLLELSLPDSQGIVTFDKVFAAAPEVPILILGGNASEALAIEAVGHGAEDHLPLNHLDSYSLTRALRNAIERKALEEALYDEKERALVTLNSIGDAVLCTDVSGNITYLNFVAETMTGWRREEATGKPLAEVFRIIDGITRKSARDPMEMAVEQNRTVGLTVNCVLIRRDGFESAIEDSAAPIHDRAGLVTGAVIVFHDVSAARAMSLQMTHAAQHDVVTNLPNRLLLNDRITQAIALARRQKKTIAVIFLDLDRFKYINDSLGHATGDQLIQSVAKRLLACVRASDTISRQGGDEFAILLSEIATPEDAAKCAAHILLSLSEPHSIGGQDLRIVGSIGISVYPEDGEDAETLIKNADTAMYHGTPLSKNPNSGCFLGYVRSSELIDSIKREKLQKQRIRPTEVHSGYTGAERDSADCSCLTTYWYNLSVAAPKLTHEQREKVVLDDLETGFLNFAGPSLSWVKVPQGQDPRAIGLEFVEWLDDK